MNAQYDKNRAAEELHRQTEHRIQNPYVIKCAANVTEDEEWALTYQSIKYGSVWRLVMAPQEGTVEEVILSDFHGVIYKKDLAPFNPKNFTEKASSGRFVRQSLTLCGLKTPLFEKSVNAVLEIHAFLARSVGQDEMEPCSMVSRDDEGDALLHMSNRYLTPKKESFGMTPLPIPKDVDPQGYLGRIAGENFIYTDDNHVRYWERRRVPGAEEIRFEECKPVIFRAGDLVEAQVAFIIISLRDGKKKTAMVLRSLLLLDGTITQRSMVAEILKHEHTPQIAYPLKRRIGYNEDNEKLKTRDGNEDDDTARPPLRRKVGYEHESISEATQRMSNMEIEGEQSKGDDLD